MSKCSVLLAFWIHSQRVFDIDDTASLRIFTCTFFLDFDLLSIADATVQIIKTLEPR